MVLSDQGFAERVVASGKAPLLPGQKVAVAARLGPEGTVLLEESLKRPTSDISVEFDMTYTAFLPAFEGKIVFDWDRFKSHIDNWKLKYKHKKSCKWWIFGCKHSYTEDEMREVYDFLCENQVVRIEWTERIVDERLEAIRQAFFRFMETSFFDQVAPSGSNDDKPEEEMGKPKARGDSSLSTRFIAKSEEAFKSKTISMRATLPVKVPYRTVGNISSSWYNHAREEHPELFAEINVDDPFFQQRPVAFTLDLDAMEIFDQAINFVTVEVRKRRRTGRDFHTSFTLTKDEVAKNGPSRTVTYAKMRDDSPEVFEYLVRWSLRGGIEWPANPSWKRGSWEGVTLSPPVRPLTVEAEADLDELQELGIRRATVEVQYRQFGKNVKDRRSIHLSPAKGEPIGSIVVFLDRDHPEWRYRVTYYHQRLGRLPQPWRRGGADGYIFLVAYDVPEDVVRDAERELARKKPGAKLAGPVSYQDGRFGLTTAITDPQAGFVRKLVGTGAAPVMAGHKATASMHLTPLGASLLWESFHQSTAPISAHFEMTLSGYYSPVEARMEVDWEKVNQVIEAGAAGRLSFVAFEVDALLQKMVQNGAIKIELVGAPPSQWNDIQKIGLDLARSVLFERSGTASLQELQRLGGGSLLDRYDRGRAGGNRRSSLAPWDWPSGFPWTVGGTPPFWLRREACWRYPGLFPPVTPGPEAAGTERHGGCSDTQFAEARRLFNRAVEALHREDWDEAERLLNLAREHCDGSNIHWNLAHVARRRSPPRAAQYIRETENYLSYYEGSPEYEDRIQRSRRILSTLSASSSPDELREASDRLTDMWDGVGGRYRPSAGGSGAAGRWRASPHGRATESSTWTRFRQAEPTRGRGPIPRPRIPPSAPVAPFVPGAVAPG